jgi:prolyl oligopeptidase
MPVNFRRYGLRKSASLLGLAGFVLVFLPARSTTGTQSKQQIAPPPVAPVKPVTTDYYATKVVDPYRYMENLKDPKVQAWMKAQNDYTRAVLAKIPGRKRLLAELRKFDRSVPVSITPLPGDRYALLARLPGDKVDKLYLRQGLDGKDKILVDPEKVRLGPADKGTGGNSITYFAVSQDGKYVAAAIASGGAERDAEIHVFDAATGRETGDVIRGVPAAIPTSQGRSVWLPDNRSFVYSRRQKLPPGAPVTEVEQKVRAYLHVLGTNPASDRAVFGYGVVPEIHVAPQDFASVEVPPGSPYAIGAINSSVSPNSAFYIEPVRDLGKSVGAWRKVADLSDDIGSPESATAGAGEAPGLVVHGNDVYLLSYKNSPRYEVIRTDGGHPDLASAEVIVPPSEAVVTEIHAAKDALYVRLQDGIFGRVLRVPYGPDPDVKELPLPFKADVDLETDPRRTGALLGIISWTRSYTIYAYDPKISRLTRTRLQPVNLSAKPPDLKSVEVKVRSYDGTLVPMSIVYRKAIKLDGSNPTLLIGYGAYGDSLTPSSSIPAMGDAWNAMGGIGAVCHVRGGGAYGEAWHLAGKGPTKPNTWRDFIACAQYLIRHKYTSPAHLAGLGISAGGITIGRAITTRPGLFDAALDISGCSDMLREETTANGEANIAEFGSTKTKQGFEALYAMSPYAHIKPGTSYPAVLFTVGMNDPMVSPWEADKMTARLLAATSSGKPVLLRVDYAGSHGIVGATNEQFEEFAADTYSFLFWQLGVPDFQPAK